jgi:hypothetical protein
VWQHKENRQNSSLVHIPACPKDAFGGRGEFEVVIYFEKIGVGLHGRIARIQQNKIFNYSIMKKKYTLILCLVVMLFSCSDKKEQDRSAEIVSAKPDSGSMLLKQIDSLKNFNDSIKLKSEFLFDEFDADELKSAGIKNPQQDLRNDLEKRKDLMPGAVLGGTMTLDDITLIKDKWVIAGYSDGHVIVTNLLKYKIVNGKIKWQLLDSHN